MNRYQKHSVIVELILALWKMIQAFSISTVASASSSVSASSISTLISDGTWRKTHQSIYTLK